MKGLDKIPTQKNLLKAYKALQVLSPPSTVSIKTLALWSQWSRLDPRLGEILVQYLSRFWPYISPVALNQALKKEPWPSAFGVLINQVPYCDIKNKAGFRQWSKSVMADIAPAPDELFFIGLYKIGGKQMKNECLYSLKSYRKWGYFAKDLLINKAGAPAQA